MYHSSVSFFYKNQGANASRNRLFGVSASASIAPQRAPRAPAIRRRLFSRRLPSLRFSALLAASPPSLNCAPVLQGNFCTYALPRIVNPAQVALPSFALFPLFCIISRKSAFSKLCAGVARKSLYSCAPAHCKSGAGCSPVVCPLSAFLHY